jgi:hypothetical protein
MIAISGFWAIVPAETHSAKSPDEEDKDRSICPTLWFVKAWNMMW